MVSISLRQWKENYINGLYDSPDVSTMCKAGWYDWFCKDTSLKGKLNKMAGIVIQLHDSKRLNLDEMYVFFKNCCPASGPLYDQFKICDLKTGDVIYCISINDKRRDTRYEVYGAENEFDEPLLCCNKSNQLVNWFNEK